MNNRPYNAILNALPAPFDEFRAKLTQVSLPLGTTL
jgi:hypothetical protein